MALHAKISRCKNLKMTGNELRRLRNHPKGTRLSRRSVGELMDKYRIQIERWEDLHKEEFELHPVVMEQLLTILGATSL